MISTATQRTLLGVSLVTTLALTCGCGSQAEPGATEGDLADSAMSSGLDAYAGTTVKDVPHAMGMIMARLANPPVRGQQAPDSVFVDANTGEAIRLSELVDDRPVVLLFGSASCWALNVSAPDFAALADRYADAVDFRLVYLREAHPAGGFQPRLVGRDAIAAAAPVVDAATLEERKQTAGDFCKKVKLGFPALVDRMDDEAAVQWGAWPLRIFVIGQDLTVLYAGGHGPWFFKPVNAFEHIPVGGELEQELRKRPFDRNSLEDFLGEQFGNARSKDTTAGNIL